jgi:hypothetical protein
MQKTDTNRSGAGRARALAHDTNRSGAGRARALAHDREDDE